MRIFSWTVIFLCAGGLLVNRTEADEASHRKAVMELFKLAEMETMMDENIDMMVKAQIQMMPGMAPVRETFKQFVSKYMSWKSLESEFVSLYMKAFSEPELKQMLVFYKTPVGKKTLKTMPKLMQEGAQVGAQRVQQHMPELIEALQSAKEPGTSPAGAPKAPPPAAPAPAPQPKKSAAQ